MSQFVDRALEKLALPAALILFVIFSAYASLGYFLGEQLGTDFGVYWRVANGPVEDAYVWPKLYGFPYAPTMLLWIKPLAFFPRFPTFIVFNVISIVVFLLVSRRHISLGAAALVLISPAAISGLLTGQVSLLLGAGLLAACALKNRIAAGILFGLIASVKPQLVMMAPLLLLLARDWRALAASVVSFLFVVLLSIILFGTERWIEWQTALSTLQSVVAKTNIISRGVTPNLIFERIGLPRGIGVAIGLTAGVALVWWGRKSNAVEQSALIGTASLFAAPYALQYDLIVIMPLIAASIVQRSFWASIAAIPVYPIPLLCAAYELLRKPTATMPSGNSLHGNLSQSGPHPN